MPQRFNLDQPIIDHTNGQPYQRQIKVNLTLKDAIVSALLILDNGNTMPIDERVARGELAERMALSNGLLDLNRDEVELIRHACEVAAPIGWLWPILQALQEPVPPAKAKH